METELPWFRELSADDRSWVGLIVQAGVKGFVDWYSHDSEPVPAGSALAAAVFGAAPRALTGVINLQQTVDLVKLSLEVVESSIDDIIDPGRRRRRPRRGAPLRPRGRLRHRRGLRPRRRGPRRLGRPARGAGRRLACCAARPTRPCMSRASALGWSARGDVAVVLGRAPRPGVPRPTSSTRYAAWRARPGMDALCATQGERLWSCCSARSATPARRPARSPTSSATGPVVVGPVTDGLDHAHVSARAAMSAYRAASGWPEAPAPVDAAAELLPERVLAGDGHARRHLVDEVYLPLLARPRDPDRDARGVLRRPAARSRPPAGRCSCTPTPCATASGRSPTSPGSPPATPRDAFALRIALVLGRQSGRSDSL